MGSFLETATCLRGHNMLAGEKMLANHKMNKEKRFSLFASFLKKLLAMVDLRASKE
jgi:hypothetical protein